jgi:RNA polymerase sigma factor (sigma-70 family)
VKNKKRVPWLNEKNRELPFVELAIQSKDWSPGDWQAYLQFLESPRRESLVPPSLFGKLTRRQVESIFEQFAVSANDTHRELCNVVLGVLPPTEAKVLRQTYFDGRSQRQIGAGLGISQSTVKLAKKHALARIRSLFANPVILTRRYIGEEKKLDDSNVTPIWEHAVWGHPPFTPVTLRGIFLPDQFESVVGRLQPESFRRSYRALPEDEQRMLYLRHWCCLSTEEAAAKLCRGVKHVSEVSEAALSRLKRHFLFFEAGINQGGAPFTPLTPGLLKRTGAFLSLVEVNNRDKKLRAVVRNCRAYLARDNRNFTRAALMCVAYGIQQHLDKVWELIPARRKKRKPVLGQKFDDLAKEYALICAER